MLSIGTATAPATTNASPAGASAGAASAAGEYMCCVSEQEQND